MVASSAGGVAQTHGKEGTEGLSVREVSFDAPWQWLDLGWRDLWATPQIGLAFGAAAFAGAVFITAALFWLQALPLLLPLSGGFLLLGPMLAVGLYEVSRRRELGESPGFGEVWHAILRAPRRLSLFGVLLLLIYFFWVRIAFLLFMLLFGPNSFPPLPDFIPTLLFTPYGLGLLVAGTVAGGVLAATTFAISAIAVPLLFDRRADPITASVISIQAVRLNPKAMALWAALIGAATLTGFATLFIGLLVTFPLIGHATWHAYRDLIQDER